MEERTDGKVLPFGQALRLRRKILGFTQESLSSRAQMNQTTLSKWEQQTKPPPDSLKLRRAADALRVDLKELVSGFLPYDLVTRWFMTVADPEAEPELLELYERGAEWRHGENTEQARIIQALKDASGPELDFPEGALEKMRRYSTATTKLSAIGEVRADVAESLLKIIDQTHDMIFVAGSEEREAIRRRQGIEPGRQGDSEVPPPGAEPTGSGMDEPGD